MNILNTLQNWLLRRVSLKGSAVLRPRDIYILPTKEGLLFAIFAFILLAAAINFNNSLVFFSTFMMVGIGLVSMHMTQKNLLKLELSISHVKPVFCFQNLSFPVIIKQSVDKLTSSQSDNYSIEIQFSHQSDKNQTQFFDVLASETTQLPLSLTATKRGLLQLPPLTLSTRYPLGLFRAWTNIQLFNDAVIYPKPADKLNHKNISASGSDDQGITGHGFDDFSGFKSYQAGEPLSHIHWKAYAREQGLLTKTFTGGSSHEYWLDWNDLNSDTETRLSELCRLIIEAEEQGDRYGLILPGVKININQGQQHQHKCLKSLALYEGDYA